MLGNTLAVSLPGIPEASIIPLAGSKQALLDASVYNVLLSTAGMILLVIPVANAQPSHLFLKPPENRWHLLVIFL